MGNRIVAAIAVGVTLIIGWLAIQFVYGLVRGTLPIIFGIAVGVGACKVVNKVNSVVPKQPKNKTTRKAA